MCSKVANSRTLDMPPCILLATGHLLAIYDKASLLEELADAEIVMVARESNLYLEQRHLAQLLMPATVYLILATVY